MICPPPPPRGGSPAGGRALQDDSSRETLLTPPGDDAPSRPDLEYAPRSCAWSAKRPSAPRARWTSASSSQKNRTGTRRWRWNGAAVAATCAWPASSAAWPPGRSGEIAGPDDVKRRREEICAYHAWHAPSTPVPMLLRRAQRLVGADFLVLMKRLAPAGIDALQRVTGPPEES
ncbi:hypothetical protein ACU13_19290 [Xanthomonas oryzae pv. oryzicola]|nr:hypothetical protein ACU13_19290 [Xanthomonas oryzae pv. oryzicola]AKO17526.1 hypothetical protein ACU12_19290 [Xanthomonas oryzae pv. oryzicola]